MQVFAPSSNPALQRLLLLRQQSQTPAPFLTRKRSTENSDADSQQMMSPVMAAEVHYGTFQQLQAERLPDAHKAAASASVAPSVCG